MHQPLSTDPNDFCFIDTETRSSVNVKDGGAYQHNANGRVIICTYAIGDADVQEWVLEDWTPGRKLDWRNAPRDLAEFLARVEAGSAWFVAWNAAFDRLSLSRGMLNKTMRVEWFIDAMAQAVKSHLPPDLMGACLAARVAVKKQASGKALIKLFCDEAGDATPQSHPEEWMQFRSYAHDDIPSMREIFWGTMPLSRKEWEEYWANERINDRGMPVDVPFVKAAAELAEFSAERANEQVFQITKGHIDSVNKTAAILAWVQHKLRMLPEVNRILLREVVEEPMPEGEDVRRVEKHSLDRGRVEELIAYLERVDTEQGLTDDEHDALQLLEVRLYGASATPKKFGKMVPMIDDGRIKGQYVFNGASATGRFSSRGVQCVGGEHEVLTRAGWTKIKDAVGTTDIMAWCKDSFSFQWETARIKSYGHANVAEVNGTIIRGVYTWDHRMPRLNHDKSKFCEDVNPRIVSDRGSVRHMAIRGRSAAAGLPLSDDQIRVLVAMQSDGTWSEKAAVWNFAKDRKYERLMSLLKSCGIPFTNKTWSDGTYHVRVNTGDVPSWLVKDFGVWVLGMSAAQAYVVVSEYALWDGWSHKKNGALVVSSPRLDQMEWLQTIVALSGRTATLEKYTDHKGYDHWRLYVRTSDTTTLHAREIADGGVQEVFCPTVPSGYWLCRYGNRVFVTGNTHNLSRMTVGSKDDELDAIEMVTNKGVDAYEPLQKRFGPVGKTLSRLIRPAFCAPEGHTFVWCDWSAIEARVLPWLSGSPSSEEYLNIFRTNDKDPSLPDIYKVQAGKLLNKDPKDVTKHERQSHGKVPCIAEGQLVLTDHGEVPIERVTVDMKVWDGLSFVSHQGLVFKGVKDVWEYQGVVATADHIVWTEEAGQLRLIDAARRGYNLVQSGAGRTPVWVGDSVDGGAPIHETKTSRSVCADSMCGVRVRAVAELEFPVVREDKRMPILLTATSCAEMVESTHDGGEESLHQPERPKMGALRRERGHVRLPIGLGCVSLGAREHRLGQNKGTGPHRQLERVCAGEFEVGIAAAERGKPEEQRYTGRLDIHTGGMAIRVSDSASETFSGRKNTRGDTLRCASRSGKSTQGLATYRGKARVYDLVNAGPRHRFTVAGKLVHNCLSLGFAGGKGALFNMARIYGASFTEEEAEAAVRGWRDSNPWAKRFWSEVWDAAQFCMENPGHSRAAGRAMYVYDNDYMGGTLFAVLPCGRALLYPRIRWENRETKDRATGAVVEKMQLTYRRGRGRAVLWVGVLVENLVQAFAGSLLRHALWRLDKEMPEAVIAHTHDEIICMCKDEDAVSVRARLEALMKEPPEWAEGLPLSAESVVCPYYSKTVD